MAHGSVIACHTVDQWKEQLQKDAGANKLVVVDFTASWCFPCRFISPVLDEWAKKYPHVTFLKVDVDELRSVSEENKVDAMPTFLFFKDGKEVDRVVGARKETLLECILKYADNDATVLA